jgi:thioredoxin-related protein
MTAISPARRWRLAAPVVLAALVSPCSVGAQEGKAKSGQDARSVPVFDEQADAMADIAAALAKAKRDNQHVLLMFGANWCDWSRKLDTLFRENRDIARALLYEYELVKVDIGRRDKNMDIADGYGADVENSGIPYLTVLDAGGNVLANQETGALELDDAHDPAKVQAFLKRWQAEPLDAQAVLKSALAQAAQADKRAFLYLSAPSCPWCRRLEEFLARPDIAKTMARDFNVVKIDIERMKRGPQVAKRFRPDEKGGTPWFAVLDGKSHVLATSNGPKGNVGFPVEPQEIAHFMEVLKKTTRRIPADDLNRIEQALNDSAAKIKAAPR